MGKWAEQADTLVYYTFVLMFVGLSLENKYKYKNQIAEKCMYFK